MVVDEEEQRIIYLQEIYILLNAMKLYAHENNLKKVKEYKNKMGKLEGNIFTTKMESGSLNYYFDGARNGYQNSVSTAFDESDRKAYLKAGDEFFYVFEKKLKKAKIID